VSAIVRSALRALRRPDPWGWIRANRLELGQVVRVTVACALAWVLAQRVLAVPLPVMAPLAALLTVQVTVYRTVTRGIRLMAGVLVGLAAALGFAHLFGLNTITLTVSVFVSLVLGRLMRLGEMVNQVALTAMFVIGLGQHAGFARLYDSLIGIAAGVLVNAFSSPRRYLARAGEKLAGFADWLAELCAEMAERIRTGEWDHDVARAWLQRARVISRETDVLYESVRRAEEGLKVSPRRGTLQPSLETIGEATRSLDHAAHLYRGLVRRLTQIAAEAPEAIPPGLADLLDDLREAFTLFGRIQSSPSPEGQIEELRGVVRRAEQHQRRVAEKVQPSALPGPGRSVAALLDDAQWVLYEMDPDHGPHRQAVAG
jgi:hypothetical protein